MKLAIYDFDGTLFKNETLPFIVKYYSKNNYPKDKLIKFYMKIIALTFSYKLKLDATLDKEKYRATAANIFMYLFEDMNKDEVVEFFAECTKQAVKYFNPAIVNSVIEKKSQGFHTVVCSGANTILLSKVANYVKFDTVIGTELDFSKNGSYDFNAPIFITTGKNKPIALLNRFKDAEIDWEKSFAYGDSYYDYDIMNLTGNPIAVNPDKGLRKIAIEKGWNIFDG